MTTFQRSYDAMGSRFSVRLDLWPNSDSSTPINSGETEALLTQLEEKTEQLEQSLSRFRQDSELMTLINSMDQWTTPSPHMEEVLKIAEAAMDLTACAFDPRILPRLEEIGYAGAAFNNSFHQSEPSSCDPAKVFHRNEHGEIKLVTPIDLGGIGKGYTADCLAEMIESAVSPFNLAGYIIDAGGDLVVSGCQHSGDPWNIGIENPLNPSTLSAVASPVGNYGQKTALCTSSLWRNAWVHEGKKVHHLIDPATGSPVETQLYSVTALADSAATAEVVTKYILLRGFRDAPLWRDYTPRCLWITKTGNIHMNADMEPFIVWLATD
ncbi:FAD:protein FMN transferase [Alicyclobacillus sp. SO9]|uniref:FAD:protein FMN transferase n=1 Tax=Alicyclobacillus sp. SO9 TaxID=2665646 RepID=UPI0018E89BDC|nr:FAD:protein FMN transferase [Alicyclobacillus sp. SO9]QQE79896.1 FAD:protein FMN transferase [Alicyclobacillus sp. SO9]